MTRLPRARGPMSADLLATLRTPPGSGAPAAVAAPADPLGDDDLQLALALCYELHHAGLPGVDPAWEWDAGLLGWRAGVEAAVEAALRREAAVPVGDAQVDVALRALVAADDGPGLATHLMRHADDEQLRDYLRQRSVYHLQEADPQTWVVPRVHGPAKAALVEIQADEYGAGLGFARMHSTMYAATLRAVGVDATYGAHWDSAVASMLAIVNAMRMFGLHRRLRGASVGQLTAVEMTSSASCRRISNGLRRLGYDATARAFYDEHVEADAVHEQLAAVDLCGALVAAEPDLRADVLFGAAAYLALERRFAAEMLARWGVTGAAAAERVA